MPKKRKRGGKRYISPSVKVLDAESSKALLEAKGQPDDPGVQEMLNAINAKERGTKAKKVDE
jgi:hypothetical protein